MKWHSGHGGAGLIAKRACLLSVLTALVGVTSLFASAGAAQAIVGGTVASPQLPAVGLVHAAHFSSADPLHRIPLDPLYCSGSLVGGQWLLTAQHCTNIN